MMSYAWLIPLFPILAFVAIVFFTRERRELSARLAVAGIFLSFLVAIGVLFAAISQREHIAEEPFHIAVAWFPVGTTTFDIGFMIDPLAAATLVMVTTVCLMIFIYSQGYMHGDPRYSRFFAYISLFATGMLGLVISDNLLEMFVFWEIMGLCSYLLIGFWFEKPSAANAAKKAFITTRVGDVILFMGMLYLYSQTGTLSFLEIFGEGTLHELAARMVTLPLAGSVPVATVIGLLIFGGAVGKSAQFPLHVWLPDAMEGPTPVSALIHAATMVAAGVFLVARTFPIFSAVEHSVSLQWVAAIGAFTALFASTIAVAQDDIKRVLAYSTISQLGYMVMALGIGGFVAGVFHLITHAFFKALLFLGSGSVIHGMEHGMHETGEHGDPNDMMAMGGLRERMPATFWTFLAGTLALAGIPPLAGFWSKDEILGDAFSRGHYVVWAMGTAAAFLTAFYMGRQIFLVFFGQPRTRHAGQAHESPFVMTGPLIVLAIFAVLLGFVGIPEDISPFGNPFHAFVGEAFPAGQFNPLVAGISVLVALAGLGLGYLIYGRNPLQAGQRDPLRRLGFAWSVLRNKYWIDEFYGVTVVRLSWLAAALVFAFDRRIIDGLLHLTGRAALRLASFDRLFDIHIVNGAVDLSGVMTGELGQGLRRLQTGRLQNYLLVVFTSVVVLAGLYLMR